MLLIFYPRITFYFSAASIDRPGGSLEGGRRRGVGGGRAEEKQRDCQARGSAELALHPVLGELAEGRGGQGDPEAMAQPSRTALR